MLTTQGRGQTFDHCTPEKCSGEHALLAAAAVLHRFCWGASGPSNMRPGFVKRIKKARQEQPEQARSTSVLAAEAEGSGGWEKQGPGRQSYAQQDVQCRKNEDARQGRRVCSLLEPHSRACHRLSVTGIGLGTCKGPGIGASEDVPAACPAVVCAAGGKGASVTARMQRTSWPGMRQVASSAASPGGCLPPSLPRRCTAQSAPCPRTCSAGAGDGT